jgi:hypothetical protein
MSAAEIEEVLAAVADTEAQGLAMLDITRENFSVPGFAAALADIHDEIMDGRGFALIRGLPLEGRSRDQTARAFWGIACHMGRPMSQNGKGHLLGHVQALSDNPMARGYMSGSALDFHTDRTDILSLCCLRQAKSGGQHRICSSVAIYNEMLSQRPDLVQELTWRFYRSRNGEIPPGESEPWTRQPIFSVADGYFAARGPSTAVYRAQKFPGVPPLTDKQKEAIKTFETLADELALDIDLERGDITYVMCHVTQHSRTDFEDWPEPERKRHLLRMWLNTGGERPLDPDVAREIEGVVVPGMTYSAPLEAE